MCAYPIERPLCLLLHALGISEIHILSEEYDSVIVLCLNPFHNNPESFSWLFVLTL
jgi:hypothetical protein